MPPLIAPNDLDEARRLQEAIMTDRVILERHNGDTTDEWGTATPRWVAVYTGPGLVQSSELRASRVDSAGRVVAVTDLVGKLPWTVTLSEREEYRLRCTASEDPQNVGTYEAAAAQSNGLATCRRLHLTRTQ